MVLLWRCELLNVCREIAYQLRVRLLEAIDQNTGGPSSTRRERGARGGGASIASSSVSGTGGAITDEWDEFLAEEGELGATFPGFDGSEDRIASASAPATAASYAEAVDYDETTETAAYSCGACVDDLGRWVAVSHYLRCLIIDLLLSLLIPFILNSHDLDFY